MTRLRAGRPGLDSRQELWRDTFSSPPRLDRLWGPPSLLSHGYQGFFPVGRAAGAWSWPLTSIQCRSQKCVVLYFHPPYIFMLWCSVKCRDNFTLPFWISTLTWCQSFWLAFERSGSNCNQAPLIELLHIFTRYSRRFLGWYNDGLPPTIHYFPLIDILKAGPNGCTV
jgi:hypothetical protein